MENTLYRWALFSGLSCCMSLMHAGVARADPLLKVVPLEQDRVSPSNPAKNLPLQTEPGKADYLLYNHLRQSEANVPILYLKIPEEYIGASPAPVHNFGMHFYIWYPEMTGSLNPANQERIKCLGYCNGKIHLMIENTIGLKLSAQASANVFHADMDRHLQDNKQHYSYVTIKNDGIEEIYIKRGMAKAIEGDTSIVFIKKNLEGKYVDFIECEPNTPSPGCTAFLNIGDNAGVSVEYSFSMSMLKDWKVIRDAVERIITSFSPSFVQPEIRKREGE